ncbi:MAG: hypothetical protein HRT71_19775 [Flavobacteriales bacterium]|nr:hypothetical protein [Flavobacteriales bacterium]
MKFLYTLLLITLSCTSAIAQIGINTLLPDSSSVLDLSGADNQTRGLLIPRVDPNDSTAKKLVIEPRANGLLVFDSIRSQYYFWQSSDSEWYSLNRWKAADSDTVIYTEDNSVGIGVVTPSERLEVGGNVKVSGNIDAGGNLDIGGDIEVDGSINSKGTVKQHGEDLLPPGAIIMWSGAIADIPNGWDLCDGSTYDLLDGSGGTITSPNLKGRFLVGYDKDVADYSKGNTGGVKTVTLTAAQSGMQSHTHDYSSTTGGDGDHTHKVYTRKSGTKIGDHTTAAFARSDTRSLNSEGSSTDSPGDHTHAVSGTTDATSATATASHENRPPYYTIAYIIKL